MKRQIATLTAVLGFALTAAGPALAADKDISAKPPAGFKEVGTLVKLPHFIPGMGTLYVDPATLPLGPFLGYDHQGKLANVTYMVPLKQLEAHKNFGDLGKAAAGLKIDHTDIDFNPGHPGVDEPHYHVTQWLVPHNQHMAHMK